MKSSAQGQGHKSQKDGKFLFLQCESSTGNNSRFIKHTAGCLRAAWGFRVRRIEWCNRHLCHVTTSEHT